MQLTTLLETNKSNWICFITTLHNGDLASCSKDSTVKLYKKNSFALYDELKGHSEGVSYLIELPDSRLVTSSWDKTVKVWTKFINSYKCEHTFRAHKKAVYKILKISPENQQSKILSLSGDKTFKIWNTNDDYECLNSVENYYDYYTLFQLKNREIVASDGQKVMSFFRFNLNDNNLAHIRTLNIYCLCANGYLEVESKNILLFSCVNELHILSLSSYQLVTKIKLPKHNDLITCFIQAFPDIIVCGTLDGDIYFFDPIKGEIKVSSFLDKTKTISSFTRIGENFVGASGMNKIKIFQILRRNI